MAVTTSVAVGFVWGVRGISVAYSVAVSTAIRRCLVGTKVKSIAYEGMGEDLGGVGRCVCGC